MKINKDNYGLIAIILLTIAVCFLLLEKCEGSGNLPPTLKPELKAQDSFRTIIKYKDSVRVKELVKWRNMTHINDSTPCYTEIKTIIQECDTVIKIDSTEIVELKALSKVDSIIQNKLFARIEQDSVTIVKLNKKVRRNRTIAKLAFLAGLGSGGFLGFKLH